MQERVAHVETANDGETLSCHELRTTYGYVTPDNNAPNVSQASSRVVGE